jgi:hypothetical protein
MRHFIDCLLSNLGLLALVHAACWIARQVRPELTLRGTRVYLALLGIALAFDAALTYLVFADAGGIWHQYDPGATFPLRGAAYGAAAALAIVLSRTGSRLVRAPVAQADSVTIETSPYSRSTLRM